MAHIFVCPKCGKTLMQERITVRKLCTECAKAKDRERSKIASIRNNREMKESLAIKKQKNQEQKKGENALSEAKKKADAELDARSAKQRKQCQKCKYQLRRQGTAGKMYCIGCDYIAWEGHSRDKGNGPGDCRSFEPLTKESEAERIERRRKALQAIEANNAQNTGEKMRKVN